MTLPASGPISIDDIVTEFGGTSPDHIEEYYRGGGLVTENNTNVPECATADCPINFEQFYNAQLIYSKVISVNANNIVLSDYFTDPEWAETTPKEVVIDTGVTIGSTDIAVVSCRTGILNGIGQSMGGTLKLIINGYVYGAGGLGSTTDGVNGEDGGDALNAEIALTVENNSRIYAGGGGGGKGGHGQSIWWYGDDLIYWIYDVIFNPWFFFQTQDRIESGCEAVPELTWAIWNDVTYGPYSGIRTELDIGGYIYEKGTNEEWFGGCAHGYKIRRKWNYIMNGGLGGDGGNGIGFPNQARSDGSVGANGQDFSGDGGNGGNGADWGASGGNATSGEIATNTFPDKAIDASGDQTSGSTGGSSGNYIINNGNVTWDVTGLRLGGVA